MYKPDFASILLFTVQRCEPELLGNSYILIVQGDIMSNKRIIFIVIFLGMIISACGKSPVRTPLPTSQPFPRLIGNWTIKMTQSGGIMGMLRMIEIQSDGKVHIEDQHGNKRSTEGDLTADQMKQLTGLVNSVVLRSSGKPRAACADCFIYDLQIASGGQTFSAQLNDISLPDSGLEALVHFLGDLMNISIKP